MNPGIFLIQENGDLVEMIETQPYPEDLLQTWLETYPSLLAGHQIDPSAPRRWLLIERECGVPSEQGGGGRWSADHLFLDQDAIPTIVEVKRSANTQIRREVVGQMMDYAANAVVYWPVSYMRERFATTCESAGLNPEEKLEEFLEGDIEPEPFWQLADKNLKDRNIRLLFVADEIPTELQRIVEFLNEQMGRTEVLAVEIKQFIGKGQTGLVPRVIGQTAKAQDKKGKAPVSEIGQLQLEFWTAFKKHLERASNISCPKPAPQSWMNHSIGAAGFGLSSIASTWSSLTARYDPEIRVEFWMNGSNFKTQFELLEAQKEEIETEAKQKLVWDNPQDRKRSRKIYVRKSADFRDRGKWPEQHEWLRENLERLYRIFMPRVKTLEDYKSSRVSSQSP